MVKTAQIFCNGIDCYTMILLIIDHFLACCNILQFSPCKLWRSRTTSIWLRFRRECNRSKAMSLFFRVVLFWCRIEPYKRTYGYMAIRAENFLQRRRLLYNDLDAHWTVLHVLRYISSFPNQAAGAQNRTQPGNQIFPNPRIGRWITSRNQIFPNSGIWKYLISVFRAQIKYPNLPKCVGGGVYCGCWPNTF